jgi:hypothetical protein
MGIDGLVWRIVLSDHIPDGLTQVKTWSALDVLQANLMLDAVDAIQEHHRIEAEARQKR